MLGSVNNASTIDSFNDSRTLKNSNDVVYTVDNKGHIFGLSTGTVKWHFYPGSIFRSISSTRNFIWGVDSTGIVNVYVNYTNASICVKEETYENERWMPFKGFGKQLLPTDRYQWSNVDGTEERHKDDICLLSSAWKWETEWNIELTFDGYATDEGWTYALDFPANYHANYFWPAVVRRRKWYRYRRYIGLKKWVKLPPFYDTNKVEELFSSVSAGGQNYFDHCKCASIPVWVVTLTGKVLYRAGVSMTCPEGTGWVVVSSPDIRYLSCGASSKVWAINGDGSVLIRRGISSDNPIGSVWLQVPLPNRNLKVKLISVGTDAVWIITVNEVVWFKKNCNGDNGSPGSEWTNVPGNMSCISVGSDDAVWAISKENNKIYFRIPPYSTNWIPVNESGVGFGGSNTGSVNSLGRSVAALSVSEDKNSISNRFRKQWENAILDDADDGNNSNNRRFWTIISAGSVIESRSIAELCFNEEKREHETMQSQETESPNPSWRTEILDKVRTRRGRETALENFKPALTWHSVVKLVTCEYSLGDEIEFKNCIVELKCMKEQDVTEMSLPGDFKKGYLAVYSSRAVPSSETFSCYFQVHEIMYITDESRTDFFRIVLYLKHSANNKQGPLHLRFYFKNELEDWFSLLQQVCCSMNNIDINTAPKQGSLWLTTKTGAIYVCDKPTEYPITKGKYVKNFSITTSEPGKYTLSNGFPVGSKISIRGRVPAKANRFCINLIHKTDDEDIIFHLNPRFNENVTVLNGMAEKKWGPEERINLLTYPGSICTITIECLKSNFKVCINSKECSNFRFRRPVDSITHLDIKGDIDVTNVLYETPDAILSAADTFWRKIEGYLSVVRTASNVVTWGLSEEDKELWSFQPPIDGLCSTNQMEFLVTDRIHENQVYSSGVGFKPVEIEKSLSDASSKKNDANISFELIKQRHSLPDNRWSWVTDWKIEYNLLYGTDEEGWRYAKRITGSPYRARRSATDSFRRRTWYRIRQLIIKGPWQKVQNTVGTKDFALPQICDDNTGRGEIPVWCVTVAGTVLFRTGVSKKVPSGTDWVTVPVGMDVKSICMGDYSQVFICTENGIYRREGIIETDLIGTKWTCLQSKHEMKNLTIGGTSMWARNERDELFIATQLPTEFCGEIPWTPLNDVDNIFKDLAIKDNHVWAIDKRGRLCCRMVISKSNLHGIYWLFGFMDNCNSVSI